MTSKKQTKEKSKTIRIDDSTLESTILNAVYFLQKTKYECSINGLEEARNMVEKSLCEASVNLMIDVPITDCERRIEIGNRVVILWFNTGVLQYNIDGKSPYIQLLAPEFDCRTEQTEDYLAQIQSEWLTENVDVICSKIREYIEKFSPGNNTVAVSDFIRHRLIPESPVKTKAAYKIENIKKRADSMLEYLDNFDSRYDRFNEFKNDIEQMFIDNLKNIRKDAAQTLQDYLNSNPQTKYHYTSEEITCMVYCPLSDKKNKAFSLTTVSNVLSKYPELISYKIDERYGHQYMDVTMPVNQLITKFKSFITSYMSTIHAFAYSEEILNEIPEYYCESQWTNIMKGPYIYDKMRNLLKSDTHNLVVMMPSDELINKIRELTTSGKKNSIEDNLCAIVDEILKQYTIPFLTNREIYCSAESPDQNYNQAIITKFPFSIIEYRDDFHTSIANIYSNIIKKEIKSLYETGKSTSDAELIAELKRSITDNKLFKGLYVLRSFSDISELKNMIIRNTKHFIEYLNKLQTVLLSSDSKEFLKWLMIQKAIAKDSYKKRIAELDKIETEKSEE